MKLNLERHTEAPSTTLIQTQLEIGHEDDEHEKEANQVADKVMRMCDGNCDDDEKGKMKDGSEGKLQMMHDGEEEEKKKMTDGSEGKLQMMADSPFSIRKMTDGSENGMMASKNVEQGINNTKGSGQSLSPQLQNEMGNKMGADFSGVKIHTNEQAVQMNKEVGAKAFTHGSDIYFNQNQYNPTSQQGKHLLAHELTHTMQQGTTVERMVQCMCSGCTESRASKSNPVKINTSNTIARKKIQRIPQNPTGTPFDATIIPWSAALHASADRDSKTLADLPKGHKVKVLGGQAWIQVETTFNGKTLTGYVSHELLEKTETNSGQNKQAKNSRSKYDNELTLGNDEKPKDTWHPIGIMDKGLIKFDASKPERITVTGAGVTPEMIAKEMYRDGEKHATDMEVEWNETKDGELKTNTVIPVGRWVRLRYDYMPFWMQELYDKSVPIASRKSWGAREHKPHEAGVHEYEQYTGALQDIYHSIAIHHSGNNGYKTMKDVQDYHMDGEQDKADIGYHYGVDLKGKIYEGRPIDVKGANISSGNTGVIGIVMLADLDTGYFDFDDEISGSMESALLNLIHFLLGKYPKIQRMGGHKEFNTARSCPGDLGMAKMDSWRSSTGLKKPTVVDSKSTGDD